MSDKRRKRRRFTFVNKQMHYQYVGLMVLTVFIISVIMSAFIFMSSFDTMNVLRQLAAGNRELFASLRATQITNLIRVLIALILIIIAVAVVGVLEMSKLAGPLFRIGRTARDIGDGDYSKPFRIRGGDIPHDLADAVGYMVDSLREETKKEADALDAVSSKLKSVSAQLQKGKADKNSSRELEEAISTLSEISSQKKTSLQPKV